MLVHWLLMEKIFNKRLQMTGSYNDNLHLYLDSYEENRNAFIECVSEKFKTTAGELRSIKIESKKNDGLFIDVGYFPPRVNKKRLIITSSGLHGIEGFVGSTLQRFFLNQYLLPDNETGLLFIHA